MSVWFCTHWKSLSRYNLQRVPVPSSPPLLLRRFPPRDNSIGNPPPFLWVLFWRKVFWRTSSFDSTLSQSNEHGYDDYMCKCTKSLTLQRYIIPKLQKNLKHAFNFCFLKGLLNASPEKGGCSQNQQLLVRISWHICDQHVIAASS